MPLEPPLLRSRVVRGCRSQQAQARWGVIPGLDRRRAGCVGIRHSQMARRARSFTNLFSMPIFLQVSLTSMLPPDALPPTACCATLEYHAGGWVMHKWRGLAVVACVVLGMSGAARAGWLDDAAAANARGELSAIRSSIRCRPRTGSASVTGVIVICE